MVDYLYLFSSAFISATLFPLGSEALLIYDISIGYDAVLVVCVATIGNVLGAYLNYYFGLKGEIFLEEKKVITKEKLTKAKKLFDKFGGYSLFLSWVPIIGDPITFIAGLLKYDLKKFIFIVLVAKGGRYIILVLVQWSLRGF